jgi:hypothetical protein
MVKRIFTILLLGAFGLTLSATAQDRVMLRIGSDGKQETIPMRKGESAINAMTRVDKGRAVANPAAGTRDSITNYGPNGATNFIAAHQDVMFQWFDPQAGGVVLEFGWKNGSEIGTITKSTIRGWNANIKLMSLPVNAQSTSGSGSLGNMGYYIKSDDADGLKTPFKDEATNPVFVGGKGDSLKTRFDPLGTEAAWLPNGWQFSLNASAWQSFKLLDFGDSMKFNAHEPIGFTKMNDTKKSDVGTGVDVNMLIAANGADQYPFHSIKFYEGTPTSNYGWQIRDYEWNMYAIVLYTTDRPPKIAKFDKLTTTLKTTSRTVTADVTDDNPGGGLAGVASVKLFSKVNTGAYTSTNMTLGVAPKYTGTLAAANPGDAVTYYIEATDVLGLVTKTVEVKYTIFKGSYQYLFMWNGRGSPGVAQAKYFMLKDSATEKAWYDIWDVKAYGIDDIPTLLTSYKGVIEACGDGGYADLTKLAGDWLATGTVANPKSWFWSDQDHGFISGYADTTFLDADAHAKYFGVKALVNQDYPNGITYPWQMDYVGGTDPAFGFISTKMAKDTVTLWYNPGYEWGFTNWMDELTPMAGAKALFKDKKFNTRVTGVRNTAANNSWYTAWLAFDYTSVDFLSDTSKSEGSDPKYSWMFYDEQNPATNFIKTTTGVSQQPEALVPGQFSLAQNYPNPFNPSTAINYTIGAKSHVTLKVFNVIGQEVATLVNESMNPGSYSATFSASNFSSGIYFYTLTAGSFIQTNKMVLLK